MLAVSPRARVREVRGAAALREVRGCARGSPASGVRLPGAGGRICRSMHAMTLMRGILTSRTCREFRSVSRRFGAGAGAIPAARLAVTGSVTGGSSRHGRRPSGAPPRAPLWPDAWRRSLISGCSKVWQPGVAKRWAVAWRPFQALERRGPAERIAVPIVNGSRDRCRPSLRGRRVGLHERACMQGWPLRWRRREGPRCSQGNMRLI